MRRLADRPLPAHSFTVDLCREISPARAGANGDRCAGVELPWSAAKIELLRLAFAPHSRPVRPRRRDAPLGSSSLVLFRTIVVSASEISPEESFQRTC